MRKEECEKAIRSLCSDWYDGLAPQPDQPSFSCFVDWLRANNRGHFLEFRSLAGPLYDAEMWFDQELKQAWRN